ncbi:MAG: hypothetical protein KatS3mg121_1334 [Gammaproteobacteria bacterium]|nr:MAG: hypothetical protein KatS3mg121_1334 [Gammaproteobacteria bacterium]
MTTLFVEHLTVLDSSHLDAERGLVGESWIVDVELDAPLDEDGMVLDFGVAKPALKQAFDALADHRLIVPRRAPALRRCECDEAGRWALSFESDRGPIDYQAPAEALCLLDAETVNEAALRQRLEAAARAVLPGRIRGLRVDLRHEAIAGAWYRYTHGLRRHRGNCQRLCHGHRSRLEILRDGERDETLEAQWARRWRDIVLVTRSDLLEAAGGRWHVGYTAAQGRFDLWLPETHCELLEHETTVEHIAEHIADTLKQQAPARRFEVRAYEGLHKGAIARR